MKHTETHNELLAAAWLLRQGYEVFRNVSANGLIDLVAYDTNTEAFVPIDDVLMTKILTGLNSPKRSGDTGQDQGTSGTGEP